jgi:hypothetical protein
MKNLQRWLGFFLSGLLLSVSLVFGWVERSHPQASRSPDLPSFLSLCENRETLPEGLAHTVEYIISATAEFGGGHQSPCSELQRRLPQITRIALSGTIDLRPLRYLPNLNWLSMTGFFPTDFSVLAILPNLRTLHIHRSVPFPFAIQNISKAIQLEKLFFDETEITGLRFLSDLTNLNELHITGFRGSSTNEFTGRDIEFLRSLVKLEVLNIPIFTDDLSPLDKLTSLRKLSKVVTTARSNALKPLQNLKRLTALDLSVVSRKIYYVRPKIDKNYLANKTTPIAPSIIRVPANAVEDGSILEPLSNLNDLVKLSLRIEHVTDVKPLAKLVNLQQLYLKALMLKDLRPLTRLTQLKHLAIRSKKIEDIGALANLKTLTELQIYSYDEENKIRDIAPLSRLDRLRFLTVVSSQIAKIPPLQNMQSLKHLNLSNNKIGEMSGLKNLHQLTTLDLAYNKLATINSLPVLPNLQKISLNYNQLRDVNKLSQFANLKMAGLTHNPRIDKICPLQTGECYFDDVPQDFYREPIECPDGLGIERHYTYLFCLPSYLRDRQTDYEYYLP